MTYYENLHTGTGWLLDVPGILVADWSGLLPVRAYRGGNKALPKMPGEVGAELTLDAYDFTVPFSLKGATRPELYDRIDTLLALFPTTLSTLTRRRTAAATPFYVDDTANGQFRGLVWTNTDSHLDIDGVLSFRNLDGEWT